MGASADLAEVSAAADPVEAALEGAAAALAAASAAADPAEAALEEAAAAEAAALAEEVREVAAPEGAESCRGVGAGRNRRPPFSGQKFSVLDQKAVDKWQKRRYTIEDDETDA